MFFIFKRYDMGWYLEILQNNKQKTWFFDEFKESFFNWADKC